MVSKRRVVVTGLGMVTPLGLGVASTWEGIVAGRSGITTIDHIDVAEFATQFGGSVKGFEVGDYIPVKDARKMDPFIHYGIAAGSQAIEDSGLEITEENAPRIGVSIGSGIGGLPGIEGAHNTYLKGGARRISPFFVPGNITNMIGGNLSIKYGLKGPNFSIVTACSSGTHNIGDAARTIAYGDADVMLAGGAEMATCAMGLGGFGAARALSKRNDDPAAASRPWDVDRDGFVLSDGAGVIVLEEYEQAKARGAHIYAELVGYGLSGDAYHMTLPSAGGEGAQRCMNSALADAGLNAGQVDYVNAHATSTSAGDITETEAMKGTFGQHAYEIAISSTKSMTGHLLGAAGGIEAIFAILAIRDQVVPPTINLENPDPACDLDYTAGSARDREIKVAMSNSFGFGGTNGTVIFRTL